jgi:hypothetical protein
MDDQLSRLTPVMPVVDVSEAMLAARRADGVDAKVVAENHKGGIA